MPNIIYYHVLLGFYVNQSKIYKFMDLIIYYHILAIYY